MTLIFTNILEIESKLSESANRQAFEAFFNSAENYETYCDRLNSSDISLKDKIYYLKLKKQTLEQMSTAIPTIPTREDSSIVQAIQQNLDAITEEIANELAATDGALTVALQQQSATAKPDLDAT